MKNLEMDSKETLHDLAAAVAGAVQAKYVALPKTGKPQPHEHTILAGEHAGVRVLY